MNDYPIWWGTTITIYNKYINPQTQLVTWYRTVINNTFWKLEHNKVTIGETELDSKKTICRIPESPNFKEKWEWDLIPNDQMSDYFTLGIGDILIRGEVEDEIDEYTSGHRSSDILGRYEQRGCMEINSVSINTGIGRNNPHYLAEGL